MRPNYAIGLSGAVNAESKTPFGKRLVTFCAAAAVALAGAETVTETPDALLEYIEATGTQYIDTGVNAETGLKARIDFSWASGNISGNDWSLLDAAIDASTSDNRNRFLMCHLYGGGGKPYFGYGLKQRKNPDGSFPFVGGQRYEIVTDMTDTNSLQLVQNGKSTFSATDLETFKTNGVVNLNLSLYVFACHLSNKATWFSKGKLYELKIWKKNAQTDELDLIRHYLPCIKNGRAGLYDKVNGTISYSFTSDSNFVAGPVHDKVNGTITYSAKSGSDFVAGPVLDKPLDFVKWVWTNGKQWFDTGVWGKSGLRSEVDLSVREYDGDHCILGTRRSNNRYYPAYSYEKRFRYAYGTMPLTGNTTAVTPTNDVSYYMDTRYLIKSDLRDGYQSVTVSRNGGSPTELHKSGQAYLTGENVVTNTMALLACHNGDAYQYSTKALIYATKIWDGDELLRDFVPVVATNAAGTAYAGLYDTVTERIYRQIGTAEFDLATQVGAVTNTLRAAVVHPTTRLEYVDSDALLDYVDLELIGKDGVEMEAEMAWLRVPNDGAFVGARHNDSQGNAHRFFLYHYWSNASAGPRHRLGYDADLFPVGSSPATANVRYRIVSRLDVGRGDMTISAFTDGSWNTEASRTLLTEDSYDGPVDTGIPLYLFAINLEGTPRFHGKSRLYSLKLRQKQQDGTYALVRDLVPVRDPEAGGAALWDKVGRRYYRNAARYQLAGGGWERPFEQGLSVYIK